MVGFDNYDLDALDDNMFCLALFLLLIFNAHMFLPWINVIWYDWVCDEACLDVWLGFVMWWILWCHARSMLGLLICDAMIRWMVGLCLQA